MKQIKLLSLNIYSLAIVGITLLAIGLSTVGAQSATTNADCPYQAFPDDLNGINYLGFNQEMHFLNTYYYSFKSFTKDIYFTLSQASAFRLYIAPNVAGVDIDVWLYNNDTGKTITHSSDATIGIDESIYSDLGAGNYKIRLLFFGQKKGSQMACPTITMECAITPTALVTSRNQALQCPGAQRLPNFDMSSFSGTSFYYDSDVNETGAIMNIVDGPASTTAQPVFITPYKIHLPSGAISTDKWGVEISLGSHFLTGGSLGLLIQDAALPTPTNFACVKALNCSIGIHEVKGRSVLRVVLTPGDYNLYIYDTLSEKDPSFTLACTPFSLQVTVESAHQTETFLNCEAFILPATFDGPGYLDDQGYLYFSDDVFLDLVAGNDSVTFTVTNASYFRAYIPETRVDIDLKLSGSNGVVVASFKWGGEEEITALLTPDTYTFTLLYFGKNIDLFCDTYPLEVGIVPQADVDALNFCNGITTSVAPELSDIAAQLAANNSYAFANPTAQFQVMFQNSAAQIPITSVSFVTTQTYYLELDLFSNFVLGDVRAVITALPSNDEDDDEPIVYMGTHYRNVQHIYLTLQPGNYTLALTTAITSAHPNLPACFLYNFNMQMTAQVDGQAAPCWDSMLVPADFNTAGYLGTSEKIHLAGQYLIPSIKVLYASSDHVFTVSVPSFFRAYVTPNDIDVDINLSEDGKVVRWSNQFGGEEAVEYMLTPGKAYKMTLKYFHWPFSGVISHNCYTFNLELAISPVDENPSDSCTDNLPPANYIPTASLTPFYERAQWNFAQDVKPFSMSLPFNVTGDDTANFRAIITYDFVWNDLEVNLKSASGQLLATGTLNYNQAEIEALQLTPGGYVLTIYEPFATKSNQFALKNCVDFQLEVALQVVDSDAVTQDTIVCPEILFPNTFNNWAYLSVLSGQSMAFQETVLADVQTGFDTIKFALTTASLLRVYVPLHPLLDVDVTLSFDGGKTIASSRTVGEEVIYNLLNNASYVLKFNYYGLNGPLPKVDDCVSFPVFVSIATTAALVNVPSINTACPDSATNVPTVLTGNVQSSNVYSRELDVKPTPNNLAFTTAQTGQIFVSLGYNDLVSSLAMKLNGSIMINGFATQKLIYPFYIGGQGFINEVIPAGDWVLSIYDPYSATSPVPTIQCAQFELDYFLNTSTPNNADLCDDIYTLPTDLYSAAGGSSSYGGPQNSKGEVRISFGHFYINPNTPTQRFQFKVPSKAVYLRFSSESDPGNDLDFHLYTNASSTVPIYSSWAAGITESDVWYLVPQATPYIFEVKTITYNRKISCNYFRFDFAIETIDTVTSNLLCPAVLPNEIDQVPPETTELVFGQDASWGSDSYLFTNTRVQLNLRDGVFRYRMSLEVPGPVILYATIGFDFVTNDFNLVLLYQNNDGSTSIVANGKDAIPQNLDSDINYQNVIQYNIQQVGDYYLDIYENMTENSFNVTNGCHYFSFQATAQSLANNTQPRIVSVNPASQVDLDPNLPLNLKIVFSDNLVFNSTTQTLLAYILSSKAVYMTTPQIVGKRVLPTAASIKKSAKTTLEVTFSGDFVVSNDYLLVIDASQFASANGLFSNETNNYPHMYRMYDCDCSGHGKCVSTSSGTAPMKCVCDDPWAGNDCSKCKDGYHGAGLSCVANTKCDATTCNGHGKCTDTAGYPECQCNTGFISLNASVLCASCDFGYVNYPNCTIQDDNEGTLCLAPILPTTLDSVEFLGFSGTVHIQDDYYLDLDSASHTTTFTIATPSLLRVYTEPHHVDVDLWLYSVNPDGTTKDLVDKSLTFGHEEVLLDVLQPGQYSLLFKYYLWDKTYTVDCETFNLELAIDTLDNLGNYSAASNLQATYCNGPAKLPDLSSANTTVQDDGTVLFDQPLYKYPTPYANYAINVSDTHTSTYLWNVSFSIAPPAEGQLALVDVYLGYQFLIGDLSLVIQSGFGAAKCKGSDVTAVSGCIYGDNEMNRNAIHATLDKGNYTLFIYAPEFLSVDLSCAIFTFDMQVTYVYDDEDYFNCDADILPANLNSPEFLFNNVLHIQDKYLVEERHSAVNFTLAVNSYVRVVAEQPGANVTVTFYHYESGQTLPLGTLIATTIAAGNFQLQIASDYIASSKHFCPVMNLEIAIEPVTSTDSLTLPDCPANGKDKLPVIQAQVPYIFENNTSTKATYYTFPAKGKTVIGVYTFTLTQVVYFYSAVASEFLRGDLRINLYKQKSSTNNVAPLFIAGTHDYNYNYIESNLDPAVYRLQIERIDQGQTYPSCIPFEFEFTLLGLSKVPQCSGEPVPLTLNSIRFLGTEGVMHYESDNFIVPQGSFAHQNIPFTVPQDSIFRAYVSPHVVDIDIKLIDPTTNKTIISGSNGINTEEAFITGIKANTSYVFQVQFWKWSKNIPTCSNFNMELAIGPATALPACPNNADFWPPAFPKTFPDGNYSFNSFDLNQQFYFQQQNAGTGLKSKTMPFLVSVTSSVHAQVGFDFLTGELALKLQTSDKKKTYYGAERPNRNQLDLQSIPPGSYELVIYEPYSTLDSIMGCSYFNFEVYIEPYSSMAQEDGFYHYIPSHLDAYPYLAYNNYVHLQGEYMMYDGITAHNQVEFSVFEPTIIRARAAILPTDEANLFNTTYTPHVSLTGPSSSNSFGTVFGVVVDQGQYNFSVGQPLRATIVNQAVDVEIVIETIAQIKKEIAAITYPPNCTTSTPSPIVLSPEGYYYYSEQETISYEDITAPSVLQSIPFTVSIPTLVFVQVGYQFIFLDVDLSITSTTNSNFLILGKHNRNLNELNVILQPGSYVLSITSLMGFPAEIGQHCTVYRLAIMMRDASDDDHVDCSVMSLVPWDLNSETGGSIDAGGPIDGSGSLTLYSNDFLVPTSLASNISFAVSEPTLVNIFTFEALSTNIDYDIYDAKNNEMVQAYASSIHNGNEKSYLFIVDGKFNTKTPSNPIPAPIPFNINMDFTAMAKGTCPAFTMQILMKPLSFLSREIACPSSIQPTLPSKVITPNGFGSASEFITSYFPGDYILKSSSGTAGFNYYIDFTLAVSSRIEVSFSYYSLASNFILNIATRSNKTDGSIARTIMGTGDWSTQYNSGITTLTQTISFARLKAGDYSLIINHPPLLSNPVLSSSIYGDLCFPFIYSLNILDAKTVYAGSVQPTSGSYMAPDVDLNIQIQFSEALYSSAGAKIQCTDSATIISSFYLINRMNNNQIQPTFATCVNGDATQWAFTFGKSALASATSYQLAMNTLLDDSGAPAVLSSQHIYSMIDTTCSSNGAYKNGQCTCASGYQGAICDSCEAGFVNTNPQGAAVCVTNQCNIDTCGCKPNSTESCVPLGTCHINPSTKLSQCTCAAAYDGSTCNRCASGYTNYPYCTPDFSCPSGCGKGDCDKSTGQCICPSNFQGAACDQCAPGYTGKDCKKIGSSAIIALETIAGLAAAAIVIGFGIWYVRQRFRAGVARYKMLPRFEIEDEYNDKSSKFPGLYEDSDEEENNFGSSGAVDKNYSINSETKDKKPASGKTHVFSFENQPSNSLYDSDDDDNSNTNNSQSLKDQFANKKSFFDM